MNNNLSLNKLPKDNLTDQLYLMGWNFSKHMISTTESRRCAQCVLHPWNFFGAYATVNWDMYVNM